MVNNQYSQSDSVMSNNTTLVQNENGLFGSVNVYNYLCSESSINDFIIDNFKLKQFYLDAQQNNKNVKGYINNNNIYNCSHNIDYPFEVYTKLSKERDIDPPGNYINIFLVKNLDVVKRLYILCNSGYWLLEPLDNYKRLVQNQNTKKMLKTYFIIVKLLYCNKTVSTIC